MSGYISGSLRWTLSLWVSRFISRNLSGSVGRTLSDWISGRGLCHGSLRDWKRGRTRGQGVRWLMRRLCGQWRGLAMAWWVGCKEKF